MGRKDRTNYREISGGIELTGMIKELALIQWAEWLKYIVQYEMKYVSL